MTPHFRRLPLVHVAPETADAVVLSFGVPPDLHEQFRYAHGQFLTLRAVIDGDELRRSYSICSPVQDYDRRSTVRVAVKRVEGGRFSTWLHAQAPTLREMDVLPPEGRFTAPLAPTQRKHYLGIAAGSGITPLLSIIATTLAAEPESRFTLIYGNRSVASILFCDELEDLKDRYLGRLTLHHVLSRQHQEIELFNGRITGAKLTQFLNALLPPAQIDTAFICGPAGMLEEAERTLLQAGLTHAQVHIERFGTPDAAPASAPARPANTQPAGVEAPACELTVLLDGKRHTLAMAEGEHVLDAALAAGLDLPFSCRSGVCCTCRAKLVEGEVSMDRNYTLEAWEMAQGFVLTCQARPKTARVAVSYDER